MCLREYQANGTGQNCDEIDYGGHVGTLSLKRLVASVFIVLRRFALLKLSHTIISLGSNYKKVDHGAKFALASFAQP